MIDAAAVVCDAVSDIEFQAAGRQARQGFIIGVDGGEMKRRWIWWGVGVAFLCIVASWSLIKWQIYKVRRAYALSMSARPESAYQPFKQKSKVATSVFAGATKVETFRMKPIWRYTSAKTIGKIDGLAYSAKGTNQTPAFAARLAAIVLNPKTYTGGAKGCAFNPTVAFRVWKVRQFVTVVICFDCNDLIVIEQNPKLPVNSIGGVDARFRIGGGFDWFRPELVALAKEVFPNDKEI